MAKIVDNCRGFEIEISTAAVRQTFKRKFILKPDGVWIKEGDRTVASITFPLGANLNYGLTLLQNRMERDDSPVARELISNLMTVIRSCQLTRFHEFSFFPAVHAYEGDGLPDLTGSAQRKGKRLVVSLRSQNGESYAAVGCPEDRTLADMEEYLRAEWLDCEGMNAVGRKMVDIALREIGRLRADTVSNCPSSGSKPMAVSSCEALNSYELRGVGPVTENNPSRNDREDPPLPHWLTKRMAARLQKAAAQSFDGFKSLGFGELRFSVEYEAGTRLFELGLDVILPVRQDEIVRIVSLGISEHGDCCYRFANALLDSTEAEDVDTMSKFKNDVLDMFTIPMIQEVFTEPMWTGDGHGTALTYISGGGEVYGNRFDLSSPSVLDNFASTLGRHFEMVTKKDGSGAFVSELISNHMKHHGH